MEQQSSRSPAPPYNLATHCQLHGSCSHNISGGCQIGRRLIWVLVLRKACSNQPLRHVVLPSKCVHAILCLIYHGCPLVMYICAQPLFLPQQSEAINLSEYKPQKSGWDKVITKLLTKQNLSWLLTEITDENGKKALQKKATRIGSALASVPMLLFF